MSDYYNADALIAKDNEIATLRAENERLREALRHAARELAYVAMYEEVGGPDLVHTSEGDAVIALAEKLLGPMATWPEEPNAQAAIAQRWEGRGE